MFEKLFGKKIEKVEEVVKTDTQGRQHYTKEMIDVDIDGSYVFDVVERRCADWRKPYCIEFKYNINIKFLGENFKRRIKLRFESPLTTEEVEENYEESVYIYLEKLIESGDEIMDELKEVVASRIKNYIQEKNIEKLKERIKIGESLEFNMSFQIDKNEIDKNKIM